MNKNARLYLTISAFFIGMMLASNSLSLVEAESLTGLSFVLVILKQIAGYVVLPCLVWSACTEMMSSFKEVDYKSESD